MKTKTFLGDYNKYENAKIKNLPKRVTVFDTTLRDGEQMPGVSFTDSEKMDIVAVLDKLGVDCIEAGFPINSKPELEIVKKINSQGYKSHVFGLARALLPDVDACINAELDYIHIFVSSSVLHLKYQVRKKFDEILEMTEKSILHAKEHGMEVVFSPMDASRTSIKELIKICKVADLAGARTLNIPDTVGTLHALGTKRMFSGLRRHVKARLSAHSHNDFGLAVANTLAAVEAGAEEVQVTINGIGERGGNASLEQTIMGLEALYNIRTNIKKKFLTEASKLVQRVTEVDLPPWTPVVGGNAFAHEAGIHAHGVLNKPETFEPYLPEMVGQRRRIVLGKHSGKASIKQALHFLGFKSISTKQLNQIVVKLKEAATRKKRLYDEDIIVIANEMLGETALSKPIIELKQLNVVTGTNITPMASVILDVNDKELSGAALGNGPIDASANAIRNILAGIYDLRLTDFKLKSATGGTDALGVAMVEVEDSNSTKFVGEGVSTDVIMASVKALIRASNDAITHRRKFDVMIGDVAGDKKDTVKQPTKSAKRKTSKKKN